jgi:hypothetical protein
VVFIKETARITCTSFNVTLVADYFTTLSVARWMLRSGHSLIKCLSRNLLGKNEENLRIAGVSA